MRRRRARLRLPRLRPARRAAGAPAAGAAGGRGRSRRGRRRRRGGAGGAGAAGARRPACRRRGGGGRGRGGGAGDLEHGAAPARGQHVRARRRLDVAVRADGHGPGRHLPVRARCFATSGSTARWSSKPSTRSAAPKAAPTSSRCRAIMVMGALKRDVLTHSRRVRAVGNRADDLERIANERSGVEPEAECAATLRTELTDSSRVGPSGPPPLPVPRALHDYDIRTRNLTLHLDAAQDSGTRWLRRTRHSSAVEAIRTHAAVWQQVDAVVRQTAPDQFPGRTAGS